MKAKSIILIAFFAYLLCGCRTYYSSVKDVPKSDFGIIIANGDENEADIESYAETALNLYSSGKIIALVIAADRHDKDKIHSLISATELESNVALNMEDCGTKKVIHDTRDVLGYRSSYTIICKRGLYQIK